MMIFYWNHERVRGKFIWFYIIEIKYVYCKRNSRLNKISIEIVKDILKINSKDVKRIPFNALRELTSSSIQNRLNKKQ
jgi:hypothetical protein